MYLVKYKFTHKIIYISIKNDAFPAKGKIFTASNMCHVEKHYAVKVFKVSRTSFTNVQVLPGVQSSVL